VRRGEGAYFHRIIRIVDEVISTTLRGMSANFHFTRPPPSLQQHHQPTYTTPSPLLPPTKSAPSDAVAHLVGATPAKSPQTKGLGFNPHHDQKDRKKLKGRAKKKRQKKRVKKKKKSGKAVLKARQKNNHK
jgi:hypothetical protein